MEVWARVIKFILKSFFCCSFKVYYQGGFLVKIFKMFGSFFLSFVICANVMGAATAPDCTDAEFADAGSLAKSIVMFCDSDRGSAMFDIFAIPVFRVEIMQHLGGFFGCLKRNKWREYISRLPLEILFYEKILTDKEEEFKAILNNEDGKNRMTIALRPFFIPYFRLVKSMKAAKSLVLDTIITLNNTEPTKWLDSNDTKEALAQMLQWILFTSQHLDYLQLKSLLNADEILNLEQKADLIKAQKS